MLAWLSGMMCRLAYGPANATATHVSCSSKFRLVLPSWLLPFWYLLARVVPDKFHKSRKMIVCVCVCVCVCVPQLPRGCWCLLCQGSGYFSQPRSLNILPDVYHPHHCKDNKIQWNIRDTIFKIHKSKWTMYVDWLNKAQSAQNTSFCRHSSQPISRRVMCLQWFDAVGWAAGRASCLQKNWVVGCWHGYMSGVRCRFAYGSADATAIHYLLLQYIQVAFIFMVLPFWYRLNQVIPDKVQGAIKQL